MDDTDGFDDEDDDEDFDDSAKWGPPLPICKGSYKTLEDIDKDAPNIPEHCSHLYTIEALRDTMRAALDNYTALMKNGYDKKFNTFADAVVDSGKRAV